MGLDSFRHFRSEEQLLLLSQCSTLWPVLSEIWKPSFSALLLSEPFLCLSVPLLFSLVSISSSLFSVSTSCSRRQLHLVRVWSLKDPDHSTTTWHYCGSMPLTCKWEPVNLRAIFGSFSQIGLLSILVSTAGFLGLNVIGSLFFFFPVSSSKLQIPHGSYCYWCCVSPNLNFQVWGSPYSFFFFFFAEKLWDFVVFQWLCQLSWKAMAFR